MSCLVEFILCINRLLAFRVTILVLHNIYGVRVYVEAPFCVLVIGSMGHAQSCQLLSIFNSLNCVLNKLHDVV